MIYLILIGSILGTSFGQILFKKSALIMKTLPRPWYISFNPHFLGALAIYGMATLVWIWVLQYLPLSRAYVCMSLSFIIVPVLSSYFFNDALSSKFFLGCVLIIGGVFVIHMN